MDEALARLAASAAAVGIRGAPPPPPPTARAGGATIDGAVAAAVQHDTRAGPSPPHSPAATGEEVDFAAALGSILDLGGDDDQPEAPWLPSMGGPKGGGGAALAGGTGKTQKCRLAGALASPDSTGTHPGLLSAWRPAARLPASPGESEGVGGGGAGGRGFEEEEEGDGVVGEASPTPAKPAPFLSAAAFEGGSGSVLFGLSGGGGDGPVEVDAGWYD